MTLFDLAATLSLDTSQFDKGIRNATSSGQSFAETLSTKVTAKAVALGNALYKAAETGARALVDLGKSAVQAAADVAAENAQFTAAFGDIQDAATNVFAAVSRETNILSTRLRTVGTKAFSQFKGAGLEAADALAAMDTYTRLAADAAAYYDISLEDADARLRSFLRGNTEAGDAIGLFTSESQRNTYALDQYGKKWVDLTEAQKQMLMLKIAHEIYEQSGALGQAAREGSNWANVVANLKESWRQTLAIFGEPFVDALSPFVENLTATLNNETFQSNLAAVASKIGEIAGYSLEGLMEGLNTLLTGEVNENSYISKVASNILSAVDNLKAMSAWVNENKSAIEAFFGALALALMAVNLPLGLIIAALALVAINWEVITKAVGLAIEAVGNFFSQTIPEAWNAFVDSVKEKWNEITEWVDSSIAAVGDFFSQTIPDAWNSFVNSIAGAWSSVVSTIQSAIDAVKEFLGLNSSGGSGTKPSYGQAAGYGLGADGGSSAAAAFYNPDVGVGNAKLPGFATGLSYVPYDNFEARLHEGEAVLTKAEATDWRKGESQSIDVSSLTETISAAVRQGLSGLSITMSGEKVGDLVTDQVSRNIANAAWAGRYG